MTLSPPSGPTECEACDKALHRSDLDSPWSRGEMYRQEHHDLIASLRAEKAGLKGRLDEAEHLLRRVQRNPDMGQLASIADSIRDYFRRRLALSETKKEGEIK